MPADDADRTEQPTPRRRAEAREEGRVPRSSDLTAAVIMLVGLVLLNWLGPGIYGRMIELTRQTVGLTGPPDAVASPVTLTVTLRRTAQTTAMMILPFLATLLALGVAGSVVQSGWVFAPKQLRLQPERVNPVEGLKKLFSMDSLTRAGLGLFKIVLVGVIGFMTIRGRIDDLIAAGAVSVSAVLPVAGEVVFSVALRIALVLLVLGLIDYGYQRWRLEQSLRMTRQEVRDELKRMEGDPLIKQRRRQLQQQLALQRINLDVPRADVVVTNPTEYAVALRYDEQTMQAPKVLAKGKDYLAMRIRQVARQHGVPIVERPPLARALYATVEVGQEIPPQFYRAVAEVLAYVYRIAGKAAG